MPIENDRALTKVRGVAKRETQRALKHLQKGKKPFEVEITGEQEVIIHAESLTSSVDAGTIREKYLDFITSLHNPCIEPKITGGTYVVYDENHEAVKEVLSLNDLTEYEGGLITENYWTVRRNHNGLNLIIHESRK